MRTFTLTPRGASSAFSFTSVASSDRAGGPSHTSATTATSDTVRLSLMVPPQGIRVKQMSPSRSRRSERETVARQPHGLRAQVRSAHLFAQGVENSVQQAVVCARVYGGGLTGLR